MNNGWKPHRLKFVIRRHLDAEQKEKLASAKLVTFLAMEAIGEKAELTSPPLVKSKKLPQGIHYFLMMMS